MLRSKNLGGSVVRWLALSVLAVGALACCKYKPPEKCISIGDAKHWLVIHDKVSPSGEPWDACVSVPATDNVAYLPGCLDVEKGDTIGLINFSKTDVKITHFNSLSESDPIDLASGESKIVTVVVEGQRLVLDISSTQSHGGPGMIIRP